MALSALPPPNRLLRGLPRSQSQHQTRRRSWVSPCFIYQIHAAHHARPSYALSIINMLGCGTALGLMLVPPSMMLLRVPLSAT
jgi:hypothetical protein